MTAKTWTASVPTYRPSPARVATAAVDDLLALCRQFALPEPACIDIQPSVGDDAVSVVAQWPLPDGWRLILTLDDREHSAPRHWSGDLARMRDVVGAGRVLLDWPMHELHRRPLVLLDRLRRLGVGARAQRQSDAA